MHGEIAKMVAEHYDKLPIGFPMTKDGYATQYFDWCGWTDEEGKIFTSLTPFFEPLDVIAKRAGRQPEEVEALLTSLYNKRQILRRGKPGKYRYRYMTWGPGTYEHVGSKFDKAFADFWETIGTPETVASLYGSGTPLARVVPKEKALPFHTEILPTEVVSHILTTEAKGEIVKTTCVCRTKAKLAGKGCDAPRDGICMWFGDWAVMEAETGEGERITIDEALKVVDRGQKAGLIHAATFCGEPWWLCNCCDDCCDLLAPRKAGIYQACANSNFLAGSDPELCNGCDDCVKVCRMDAVSLSFKDEKAEVEVEKCIGCGNCVVACPTHAMHLHPRPNAQRVVYPVNSDDFFRRLAKEKGKTWWYKV